MRRRTTEILVIVVAMAAVCSAGTREVRIAIHEFAVHGPRSCTGGKAHPQVRLSAEQVEPSVGHGSRPLRRGQHLDGEAQADTTSSKKRPESLSRRMSLRRPSGRISSLMIVWPS